MSATVFAVAAIATMLFFLGDNDDDPTGHATAPQTHPSGLSGRMAKAIPPPQGRLALGWCADFWRIVRDAKLHQKSELLQNSVVGIVSNSALDMVEGGLSGAKIGGQIAGPLGNVAGAVVGIVISGVNNAIRESNLQKERTALAQLFAAYCRAVGPPPSALLVYAACAGISAPKQSEPESWYRYLLDILLSADKHGWETDYTYRKPSYYHKSDAPRVNYGSWEAYKPKSRIGPWVMYALHPDLAFGDLIVPSLNGRSSFRKSFNAWARNRPVRSWWELTSADLLSILKGAGWTESYTPASLIFEVGQDPGSIRTLDLVDLTDFLPKFGSGSVSVASRDWLARVPLDTGDPKTSWITNE